MSFSPSNLNDYIGQESVKRNIKVCLEDGRYRGITNPLEHILLCGPPGLGKTSLGEIIAKELGRPFKKYLGPRIRTIKDLSFLGDLSPWEVIFIDEIHGLPIKIEEALYEPMDKFVWGGEKIWPFTLIGATTKQGALSKPFRSRFTVIEKLVPYNKAELTLVVKKTATSMNKGIDEGAAQVIASRSRGVPRTANQLLKRVAYYSQYITADIARNALDSIGIDSLGLDHLDREILRTVRDRFRGGPVGISSLANVVNEDPATIELINEPFLVQAGLLERSGRGRCLTAKGMRHIHPREIKEDVCPQS